MGIPIINVTQKIIEKNYVRRKKIDLHIVALASGLKED